jgi:integrase
MVASRYITTTTKTTGLKSSSADEDYYYYNFKQTIKSKDTFVTYDYRLKDYMKYRGIEQGHYSQLIEGKELKDIEHEISRFIAFLKERNYSLSYQRGYLYALNHFYDANDITIRTKKISKYMSNDDNNNNSDNNDSDSEGGDGNAATNGEKPYTREQIAKLLEFSDIRTKVIILLMCSSGMRVGALPILKIGDLTPIPKHQIYQIRVYANSKSNRHYTFCTIECRKAVDNYIDFRRSCGEDITPRSPLLRQEFDRDDKFQVAKDIRPLSRLAIRKSLAKVLYESRLRVPLPPAADTTTTTTTTTRRETAITHGFRKFFDTTCTHSGMNPIYIEWCMGHKLKGVKDSYFVPQPDSNGVYIELLEGNEKSYGYIAAIDYLTIDNSQRLKRENEMLKARKDEIQQLKEEFEQLKKATSDHINSQVKELQGVKISDALAEMLYPEDKACLDHAIAKYKMEHNIID